ncbi:MULTISPECIES: DUF202 domain-containing protein [unclassified Microbacterium]|uniref:DUF202 domain-containing protein n=1 Tax=unclassified Microbacterium TaxID=2609290 RepID=UPI000CFDEB22|nr:MULTISPECIES: DUF202 domain-containing protein [unclassified Microbacterium]PRB04387.1 hypothetical protein CQ047_16715 [Microbacterium sp. MYb72]
MTAYRPFDPGLQLERTELAWRRTALSIAIGSLLSLRVLPIALPPEATFWGFAPGIVGLLSACALWFAAHRRQRRLGAFLSGATGVTPPGGAMLVLLTVLGAGFGAVALVFSVLSALR